MAGFLKELFWNAETFIATMIGLTAIIGMFIVVSRSRKIVPLEIEPDKILFTETSKLKWILTSERRAEIRRKTMKKIFFFSIPVLISFISLRFIQLEGSIIKYFLLIYFAVVIPLFIIAYSWTYFGKFAEFSYELTDAGINVRKGNKEAQFLWSDFLNFYLDFREIQSENLSEKEKNGLQKNYFIQMRAIRGEIFYLKFKPRGIFSRANIIERSLVLYTLPENYQKVYSFLLSKLEQKSDANLGFKRYYFK